MTDVLLCSINCHVLVSDAKPRMFDLCSAEGGVEEFINH